MRTTTANGRRKYSAARPLLIIGLVLLVAAAGLATMWGAGWVHFPWENRADHPPGWVIIPVNGRTLPAYTRLSPDNVIPKYVPPGLVTSEVITNPKLVYGRVLKQDRPAEYAFTERDFEPKGSRDGIVAGIPSGKRSLRLDASKLEGMFGLKEGDHIDLVATVPIDGSKGFGSGTGGMSAVMNAQAKMATMQKRAAVRVLAQDAVLVTPVTMRAKPVTVSSLTSGPQVREVPVQEVVIAVDPVEVAPISEALATNVAITCIARSGLPTDPGVASKTPGANPLDDIKVVDVISGKSRQAMLFATDGTPLPTPVAADSPTGPNVVQPASAVAPVGK